uniref:Uncharacterized protein n=1 Tax=Nannospalax galili TaxID=1026970 RepID=A0A8C6RCM9_NANGA
IQPGQRAPSFAISDMVAMGETLAHIRITLLQLWLERLLCFSVWPLSGCAQHTSLPEVVIPLRVTGTSRRMWAAGWLSYSLHFGGQRHIVHMKAKKFLVSKHLSVFTYTDQGALLEDQPFVRSDCYYLGFVEGDPISTVALTTCFGGFQGILQVNNTAYEIKPQNASSTFEHLIYKIDNEETELFPMRCGLTEEELARQLKIQARYNFTLRQSSYEGWWTHKRYLEVALVVDHQRYVFQQCNISLVLSEVYLIVNVVNAIYYTLDLDVIVQGVEIWTEGNPVTVHDIDQLLTDFCIWKKINLDHRLQHNIAHLFVEHNFGISLGLAYVGSVCMPSLNCGVDRMVGSDLFTLGRIMAHELGHNLGMLHDEASCTCGESLCLMAPTDNINIRFSNCSYGMFLKTYDTTNCLHKIHRPLSILRVTFCGNGVVEDGEECDCGSETMCRNDPCCMKGCTLKYGAACSFGLCCKDCQFMPSGTVCRENNSECDLPEWCAGTSHECPEDVYVLDGTPCHGGGYCYEKRCNNRDQQCQQIFGKEARSAAQTCYRKINTQGDRFGNCGISSHTYIRCNDSDVLCGRIQCENIADIPHLKEHSTVHWHQFNDVTCWGTDYHFGMTIPDIGEVRD